MTARVVTTIVTALGFGLSAGVFFAFSTFVMPALGRLPMPVGIAAMQSINVAAIDAAFLGVLFGSGAVACGLAVAALARPEAGSTAIVVAALVYLVGTLGVTMAANVPLNDALADARPDDAAAAALWARYLVSWTAWNHVRAGAALVAAGLLVASLARARTAGPEPASTRPPFAAATSRLA